MLTIRLRRIGKKKHPTFRIIISEKTKDTKGDYLELLGSYNPHTNKADIKADRVKYWLEKGAKASATVHNLLVNNKIIEGKKVRVFRPKQVTTEAMERGHRENGGNQARRETSNHRRYRSHKEKGGN